MLQQHVSNPRLLRKVCNGERGNMTWVVVESFGLFCGKVLNLFAGAKIDKFLNSIQIFLKI
jgi:hypothetical protein